MTEIAGYKRLEASVKPDDLHAAGSHDQSETSVCGRGCGDR